MVKEFTDFPNVGIMQPGDLPVGTRAGQNAQFDFPGTGIQDIYGNFLIGWGTVGASAVNYIQMALIFLMLTQGLVMLTFLLAVIFR